MRTNSGNVSNGCKVLVLFFFLAAIVTTTYGSVDTTNVTRIYPSADSSVYEYTYRNWNRANRGKCGSISAGSNPIGGEKRIFMQFEIPQNEPVENAFLYLYLGSTYGTIDDTIGIYRVLSSWNEGEGNYNPGEVEKTAAPGEISWVNQPIIGNDPVATFLPDQLKGIWIKSDITSLVRDWQRGVPNNGFVLKPVESGPIKQRPQSDYNFVSRESEYEDKRPYLELHYQSGQSPVTGSHVFQIETGRIEITNEWKSISFKRDFSYPVVVSKPMSYNGEDPAVVEMKNVDADGFDIRLKEWPYLDKYHTEEFITYLAVERGHYEISNGIEVEAGLLYKDIKPQKERVTPYGKQRVRFFCDFSQRPLVFSSKISNYGTHAQLTRQGNVTSSGFDLIIQEQEDSDQEHYYEVFSYIAITPGSVVLNGTSINCGSLTLDNEWSTLTHNGENMLSIKLDEETSKDQEKTHLPERVGYILFDSFESSIIADIQSFNEIDPVNLRYKD